MTHVALRKESVDRNLLALLICPPRGMSLSARRAWIEIYLLAVLAGPSGSLSARRAWIEISMSCNAVKLWASLSARRAWIEITQRRDFKALGLRRSPQGERG